MRKTPLSLALAVALVATPVALAHPGSGPSDRPASGKEGAHHRGDAGHGGHKGHKGDKGDKGHRGDKGRRGHRRAHHLTQACVVADATATGVDVSPLSVNRHMRDALGGAPTLSAKIDEDTTIRLVGRARHLPAGSTPRRAPKIGGFADLTVGDRVTVRIRAPRGTAAADLPAAFRIVDHGPSKRCAPAPPPAPPTTPEEPVPPSF
jgi:hypothetical protein